MQRELNQLLQKEITLMAQLDSKPFPVPGYDPDREKWIDLDGSKTFFLRLIFGDKLAPITEVNFFNITTSHDHKFVSQFLARIYKNLILANSCKI